MSELLLHPDAPIEQSPRAVQKALLMAAPKHQGGHSDSGMALAVAIGIRFPVRMSDLEARAKVLDFDATDLWPWLGKLRNTKGPET